MYICSMSKRRVIDVLAERHGEWTKMAESFNGISSNDANEIVQGMYLKMHDYVKDIDKIMYSDTEVNTFYVWTTMRNLFHSGYHVNGNKGKFNASKTTLLPFMFGDIEIDEDSEGIKDWLQELEVKESKTMEEHDDDVDSKWMFESLFGNFVEDVEAVVSGWYWYDAKLFKLYYSSGMSMRQIAKETGISLKSVFLSLKAAKLRLREVFQDDWDKYNLSKQL